MRTSATHCWGPRPTRRRIAIFPASSRWSIAFSRRRCCRRPTVRSGSPSRASWRIRFRRCWEAACVSRAGRRVVRRAPRSLRALRVPRRILAVAALNPGLAMQYVAGAHNDLLGIAAIVVAAALLRRSAVVACGLVVVAALIKLPFAILGLPILARCRPAPLGTLALSRSSRAPLPSPGSAPAPAIFKASPCTFRKSGFVHLLNAAVSVAALVAIAVAFLGGRRLRNAVWLMPMMGSYIASWYVTYGVPYALARRRILASLLVLMPFAALLLDAKFMREWTFAASFPRS